MLVKFFGTLINSVPGDYIVKIDFNKVLEASCRNEQVEGNSDLSMHTPNGMVYFMDVVFEDSDEKLSIPFGDEMVRQNNMDYFHNVSNNKTYREMTAGFYSKPKSDAAPTVDEKPARKRSGIGGGGD